jgi:hypothetical protein
MARGELKEAQEYAISCTSRLKAHGEAALKPFKEILLGEIAEKIREKLAKHTFEQDMRDLESQMNEKTGNQEEIPQEQVDKYIALINSFSKAK